MGQLLDRRLAASRRDLRAGDERHRHSSGIIRLARGLISELDEKSKALERSSRQLHDALDQQADLHKENARLFSATEAREARLSQILHSTSDGIIFVGPDGRIEAANLRAGDLLGFDPQTVIGTEVMRILARLYSLGDADSFGNTLRALLADPGPGGHGDLQQPSTGRIFHWVAQPTHDGADNTVGLTFTFQDVTPTRDLVRQLEDKSRLLDEARRKAEEANRAKGEFLANVTHEVRTPLSGIIGMAGLLPASDTARRIKTSAESLLAIIGDILDFSKIDSRKLTLSREPFMLRAVVQGVLDALKVTADDKHLSPVREVAADTPDELVGDALRLRQILVNLVGNAIKFTPEGEIGKDLEQVREVGIDETLIKPIARDRLFRMVETLASASGRAVAPPPELAGRAAFLEGLGNDTHLARRLIALFLEGSGRLVDDVNAAIVARDAERLRRAAHTLRGSVSNFPAGTARDAAARMEAVGLDGDFAAAEAAFPALAKEIDRLRAVLPTLV